VNYNIYEILTLTMNQDTKTIHKLKFVHLFSYILYTHTHTHTHTHTRARARAQVI